jgi:hypothetical protein
MPTTNIIDIDRVTTGQEFPLSIIEDDPRGKFGVVTINRVIAGAVVTETIRYVPGAQYRYVQAAAALVGSENAAGADAAMVSNAAADATKPGLVIPTAGVTDIVEGLARISIPINNFGWLQIRGRVYNAKVLDAGNAEGAALGASATAATLVAITGTTPTGAEVIAAIRFAAGRRAMALEDVGANLWAVELRG